MNENQAPDQINVIITLENKKDILPFPRQPKIKIRHNWISVIKNEDNGLSSEQAVFVLTKNVEK